MKKILFITTISLILFSFPSCNKTSSCGFEKSTFIGAWKISKVTKNGAEYTEDYFKRYPCRRTIIANFKDNTVFANTNPVDSCYYLNTGGFWILKTINSKNYLDSYNGRLIEITSYSCSSFTYLLDSLSFTLVKQ